MLFIRPERPQSPSKAPMSPTLAPVAGFPFSCDQVYHTCYPPATRPTRRHDGPSVAGNRAGVGEKGTPWQLYDGDEITFLILVRHAQHASSTFRHQLHCRDLFLATELTPAPHPLRPPSVLVVPWVMQKLLSPVRRFVRSGRIYSTVVLTTGPLGAVSWSMGKPGAALD